MLRHLHTATHSHNPIREESQRDLGPEPSYERERGQDPLRITAHHTFTNEMIQDLEVEYMLDWKIDPEYIAERCGWQAGHTDKFLWNAHSQTQLRQMSQLGRGSVGTVFEVQSRISNLRMALKSVNIPRWKRQAIREFGMVKNEILTMKALVHPHIVKVLGCFHKEQGTANHRFCVLLYPVGEEHLGTFLEDTCKGFVLNATYSAWIKKWFHCLASALAYMHSQNVHHDDIKPSNIIRRGEHIFFTDFSSSRRIELDQSTSTESPARATKLYAAPETMPKEDGTYDRHGSKTDVFSLGLVFMEMFCVMEGGKIEALRDQVFETHQHAIQYHRVVDKIPSNLYFPNINTIAKTFVPICLEPMLHEKRQARPTALEVCERLKVPMYFQSVLIRCKCMGLTLEETLYRTS